MWVLELEEICTVSANWPTEWRWVWVYYPRKRQQH